MWVYGLDWADPRQGQVADACECGNEPSGSVKCGEFLDQMQNSQLLKKDSAPWSQYSFILFPRISRDVNEGDVSKYDGCLQNYNTSMHFGTAEKGFALRPWFTRNVDKIYPS